MILLTQMNASKFFKYTVVSCTIVFVLFLHVLPSRSEILRAKTAIETRRLRSDLLKNYDKALRPMRNQTQLNTVGAFFNAHHIISMDEKYQILSVRGQLMLFWTDEFLRWDPQSYSKIKKIRFFPDDIWTPNIQAEYNVKPFTMYKKGLTLPVTVYSNGSVQWFPIVQFDVPCSANYRHYPFDSHNCSVILIPYGYNDSGILLMPQERPYWMESRAVQGAEWAVRKVSHESEKFLEVLSSPRTFQQINIKILLERISRIYRYICVTPTLISMVSLLFGFWLLPSETSRYLIGCGNIIILSMLLQHLAVIIPAGRDVPLLAQYTASCLSMSAIFVIITVVVNLLRECNGSAPSVLVRFAQFTADRYFCIFTFSHIPSQDHMVTHINLQGEQLTPDELKRRKDWYAVSILIDRIIFYCFAFIFVVLLSVLASV